MLAAVAAVALAGFAAPASAGQVCVNADITVQGNNVPVAQCVDTP